MTRLPGAGTPFRVAVVFLMQPEQGRPQLLATSTATAITSPLVQASAVCPVYRLSEH